MAELLEMADRLDLDLTALWYNVVLFKIQSLNHASGEYSNSLVAIEEKMENLANQKYLLIFDRGLEGKALLFKADSREELEQVQEETLDKLEQLLAEYKSVRYFGGIGEPVNRLRELSVSFESASHAFAHRYLVKESYIIHSGNVEQGDYQEEEINLSNVDPKQIDRSKIKEFLKVGNKDEAVYFVDEFFKELNSNVMKSNIFRQYITMDAYFCVVDFVESLQCSREEIAPPDISGGALQTEESAMQYVVAIMEKALELRESAASNRYGDVVEEVIRYIELNYADEELSLNLLASHVNFSPNRLSMIFSQQTGQTLIKYLTDFRMNKAKEMLRCTGKRSSEISLEVGYRDPHYFSYLFKKTQGMTPTQYRGGKSGEGEE